MKKNHDMHFLITKKQKEILRKEANEKGIFLSELCRRKLMGETQLDRIEKMVGKLVKQN